jgi:hypothetical protein
MLFRKIVKVLELGPVFVRAAMLLSEARLEIDLSNFMSFRDQHSHSVYFQS